MGIFFDTMRIDMILYNIYGRYLAYKRRREIRAKIAAGELDPAQAPNTHIHWFRMVQLPERVRLPGEFTGPMSSV